MKTAFRVTLAALAVTAAAPSYAATIVSTSDVQYSSGVTVSVNKGVSESNGSALIQTNLTNANAQSAATTTGNKGGNGGTAAAVAKTFVTTGNADSWVVRFADLDVRAIGTTANAYAAVSLSHYASTALTLATGGLLDIGYITANTNVDTRSPTLASKVLDFINIYEGDTSGTLQFSGSVADFASAAASQKTFAANTKYTIVVGTQPRVGLADADVEVSGRNSQTYSYDRSISFSLNGVTGAVPEPATWAMMILGFGLVGAALRQRRGAQIKLPA